MESVVKVSELMNHFKANGLLVISAKEFEKMSVRNKLLKREDLLSQPYLTLKQILELQLLPVKTKQGIRSWIDTGKILPKEVITEKNGIIKIKTSFLKRLGYVE